MGDTSGHAVAGTIVGSNFSWVSGAPFTGSNTSPRPWTMRRRPPGHAVAIAVLTNGSDADGGALAIARRRGHARQQVANADGTIAYAGGELHARLPTSHGQRLGVAAAGDGGDRDDRQRRASGLSDAFTTSEDAAGRNAPGVLANDSDVDGDPLSATAIGGPARDGRGKGDGSSPTRGGGRP